MKDRSLEITKIVQLSFNQNRGLIPYRTGNLRYKAVKLRTGDKIMIWIDDSVAPYGKWINQPGYKTEGWWERFNEAFYSTLNTRINAEIGPSQTKKRGA